MAGLRNGGQIRGVRSLRVRHVRFEGTLAACKCAHCTCFAIPRSQFRCLFDTQVKLWTTINEPNVFCTYFVLAASGDLTKNRFKCIRNNILGHAKAYHAFKAGKHEGKHTCPCWLLIK